MSVVFGGVVGHLKVVESFKHVIDYKRIVYARRILKGIRIHGVVCEG